MRASQKPRTPKYSKLFVYVLMAYAVSLVGCAKEGEVGAQTPPPQAITQEAGQDATFLSYSAYNRNYAVRAELEPNGRLLVDREWMDDSQAPQVGECRLDADQIARFTAAAQRLAQARYQERIEDCPMQAPEAYSGLRVLSETASDVSTPDAWMGVFQKTVQGCGDFGPLDQADLELASSTSLEIDQIAMNCRVL